MANKAKGIERPGRVTLADVAGHAGVSISTASLVVRNSELIPKVTHARVRASMQALGYIYNQAAANLRQQKTRTLGVVVADLSNPFYATVALGLEQICQEQSYVTIFSNSAESGARQHVILERLVEHNVAGIVLCSADDNSVADLTALETAGIPVVQIMRHVEGYAGTYIGPDNAKGMQLAVDHVARLGHKRVAFLGGPVGKSSSSERLKGFLAAMKKNKLAVDNTIVRAIAINRRTAMEAALELLATTPRPDAILCYNDVIAFGAMLALQRLKIEPGREVSLIGFDDIPEASLWTPSLTTISIDPLRIGQLAAQALLAQVQDPTATPQKIIIEPSLVIRDSCGASALPSRT
jgi:LacI family transcriptional regulator